MEWGWNPDSFAAVGTVGASVIATLALMTALTQARRDRIRAASTLAAAVAVSYGSYAEGRPREWNGLILRLHNSGPLPVVVSSMALRGRRELKDDQTEGFLGLEAMELRGRLIGPPDMRVRGTGWRTIVAAGDSDVFSVEFDASTEVDFRTAGICFSDANGSRWTRRRDGGLIRGWGTSRRAVRNLDGRI